MTRAGGQFWLWLAAAVLALDLALLATNSTPLFVLGDSAAYVGTVLYHYVPLDRSFSYGFYIIAPLLAVFGTLRAVVVAQTLASAASALMLGRILQIGFGLPPIAVAMAALAYSIEPLALLYQRMMLTECATLFAWAGFLLVAVGYLARPAIWRLVVLAAISVAIVSLRVSFVPVLLVAPPLLALLAATGRRARRAMHAVIALGLTLGAHAGYQQAYHVLSGMPAGYESRAGYFLLASWAPLVTAADVPPPLSFDKLTASLSVPLANPRVRPNQLFSPGGLIDVVTRDSPNWQTGNTLARRIAIHAGLRDPLGVLRLGADTFLDFWDDRVLHRSIAIDEGLDEMYPQVRALLRDRYGEDLTGTYRMPNWVKSWHAAAAPWYRFVLFVPLLWAACLWAWPGRWRVTAFLGLCAAGLLATDLLFVTEAVVRYLQPLAWMTVGALAVLATAAGRFAAGRRATMVARGDA